MFYAQKLLEAHPVICASLAQRFDELIVDEAQDTSDVQMRCLELLHATGKLHSLVLVGDLDQSIYSFQGAQPEFCRELAKTCQLTEMPLRENFRSSQAICDVTCRFCGREEPDNAVGKNKDAGIKPEILLYDPEDPQKAVEIFVARLAEYDIAPQQAAVLARARKFRDRINGRIEVDGVNKTVMALARLVSTHRDRQTIERKEVQEVERPLADMAWGCQPSGADAEEALQVRAAVMTLLEALPDFDRTLAEWIDAAREAVKVAVFTLADPPARRPSNTIKKKAGHESVAATDAFSTRPASRWARTVHDAKGESHEAVLLVVEPQRQGAQPQAELWAAPLIGQKVADDDAEELRIAYVALTRAERYCAVAMPANVDRAVLEPYLKVGFVVPE
jgi:superfamily I DNA/RNA helicase